MNLKIFVLAFLVFVKICSIYSATSDTVHANSNSNCILILVQEETSFEQITIKGTLLGIYNNGICFDPGRKSLLYDPVPSIYKFKQIEKLLNENGEIIYPFKESPLDSNLFLQNKQSDCHVEKTKTGQKKSNALWLQLGIGGSTVAVDYFNHKSNSLYAQMGLHYRRKNKVFSIGVDASGTECWGTSTLWSTIGHSLNSRWMDAVISGGLGCSQWEYNTESDLGTIHSSVSLGYVVKAQTLFHPSHLFGVGIGCLFMKAKEFLLPP